MRAQTLRQLRDERAGCVQLRRNRVTGTVVGVYRNDEAGLDDSGGELPYSTLCEDHGQCVAHPSLSLARSHAAHPEGWCEECMKPRELRESDGYADDPEGSTLLWEKGYRPIPAKDVRVGMLAGYVDVDVFGFGRVGDVHFARVTQIDPVGDDSEFGPWGYRFHHTGASEPAEEIDELTEVWAREEEPC